MPQDNTNKRFIFPRWVNYLLPLLVIGVLGGALYVPVVVTYGLSARTLSVNYAPRQPVPYSHALHVGKLGMDCRYCHTTVDKAAFAAIPPTETCMNCHAPGFEIDPNTGRFALDDAGLPKALPTLTNGVRQNSPKLLPLWNSYVTGEPVEWIKVHMLPDFVYFNHSAHVNKGVSCVSCHSRVDKMEVVYQAEPLSMSWCLDCHRAPEQHLRPLDEVYNLAWKPTPKEGETVAQAQLRLGLKLKKEYQIHSKAYMTSCSTCHR